MVVGWHRHGQRPIRQRYGLLVHQGIDRIERLAMREEHLVQGFPEILQQMEAVRDLGRRGRPLPRALGIGASTDPARSPPPLDAPGATGPRSRPSDPGAARRAAGAPGPPGSCHRSAVCAGRNRPPPAPVGVGKTGSGSLRSRRSRVFRLTTRSHWWPSCTPACAPQGHAEGAQALGQPQGAPSPGSGHRGQAFGEDTATAGAIAAKPLADAELEAHAIMRPGQVGQGALIVTVDAPRWGGAQRTGRRGLRRAHAQGDLCRGVSRPHTPRGAAWSHQVTSGSGRCVAGVEMKAGSSFHRCMSLGQRRSIRVPTASGLVTHA